VAGQRLQRLKSLTLILGLVALVIGVLRLGGWLPQSDLPPPTQTPVLETSRTPTHVFESDIPTPPNTPVMVLTRTAPADEWANALLDRALPSIRQIRQPDDGLVWWLGSDLSGGLSLTGDAIELGEHIIDTAELSLIDILVPDSADPNRLESLSTIQAVQGGITLTLVEDKINHMNAMEWRLSNAIPSLPLESLINQASRRDIQLQAAYIAHPGHDAQLVLLGYDSLHPSPTPYVSQETGTPQVSRTPVPTQTGTPTRAPEPYMGRVIAEKIDPAIDIMSTFHPSAIYQFTEQHPWSGLLTWTETGPQINRRDIAIHEATELTFYTLTSDDPTGRTVTLLDVYYVEGTTRFPADSIYFQGHRMDEILYWMVRHAAERGGQLYVAYDDFGIKQAITLVGFVPFEVEETDQ
jgi:hypothetical protein